MTLKTLQYLQSDFYHFSQTTVEAAKIITTRLNSSGLDCFNLFDVFAGCGVFSLELLANLKNVSCDHLYIIELQEGHKESLNDNIAQFQTMYPKTKVSTYFEDGDHFLEKLIDNEKYFSKNNVLIMNPPHFFSHEALRPKNCQKDRCHNIEKQHWIKILTKVSKLNWSAIYIQLKSSTQLYQSTLKFFQDKKILKFELAGQECLIGLEFFN